MGIRLRWLLPVAGAVLLWGCAGEPGHAGPDPAPEIVAKMTAPASAGEASPGPAQDPGPEHLAAPEASRRYALVFGNGGYRHGDALAAPAADARLIARALQARGYHVLLAVDRGLAGMREDIAAFQDMSRGAEQRVFYFAGHGFEFDNANYLMPVDLPAGVADLGEREVRTHALRLDQVLWELEQGAPVLVTIIDACRVAPARGVAGAAALGAEDPPEGTILAYATAPGRVALDSVRAYGVDADHSPYTYFLADVLSSPDVAGWDDAFRHVYNIVNHRTRGAQQPWTNYRVSSVPPVGPLHAATAAGAAGLFGPGISPERRAAGRYWAAESLAAGLLARDGSVTDERLRQRARDGDDRAALALAARRDGEGRAEEAARLLQPLAEAGNAVAQVDLGTALYALRAEDPGGRSARYWWNQASAQGVGEARAKLAMLDGDPVRGLQEFIQGAKEHFDAYAPRLGETQ